MSNDITTDNADSQDVSELWDQLEDVTVQFSAVAAKKDRQLNLRVDEGLLEALRQAAAANGEGSHTFARRLIEQGVGKALEEPTDTSLPSDRPFRLKEVILVLLGADQAEAANQAMLVGRTRLQKMLFLATQHLKPQIAARFEAYNYGPFEEGIESDVEFLASEGLIEATGHEEIPSAREGDIERGRRVLEWVRSRNDQTSAAREVAETYRLTSDGMKWLEKFLASEEFGSTAAKSSLWHECIQLKRTFGRVPQSELVDYVYANFPQFTAKSKIRDEVVARIERKQRT